MKHVMMLSDLYGRIGQILKEQGDAPIGHIKTPMFSEDAHTESDYIQPEYYTINLEVTKVGGIRLRTYKVIKIEE